MYKKGFTLIELLIVIAIISILTTSIGGTIQIAREKARDAKRLSDLRVINDAIIAYISDNGHPPLSEGTILTENSLVVASKQSPLFFGLLSPETAHAAANPNSAWIQQLGTALSPYLTNMPSDPCGIGCSTSDGRSYSYVYQRGSSTTGSGGLLGANDYSIYARELERREEGKGVGFSSIELSSF